MIRWMLLVSAGLIAIGAYLWTPAAPQFDVEAAREAARAYDANLLRDAYGVPHIYGARDEDVAFGLAYAHAEDDAATIGDVLNFVRGRSGLSIGKAGAVMDYLVDALNVRDDVSAKYESDLSAETRALVEAYAAGLNFYCAEKHGRCAPGMAPVTGAEVVAGFVARTPFFYGLDEALTDLFKSDPERHAAYSGARQAFLHAPRSVEIGSNAMAVAPSRADDGHTRLMINSHQPYTGPVAWYEARVKSQQGWDRIGALFPGAPLILVGAGPDNGWAFTVNKPDLVDFYALEVDNPKAPTRYRFDGGWREFERGRARFRVKLFGPFSWPVSRLTLRSIHGPAFITPSGVVAVAYGGQGDIRAVEQWRLMNKARTAEDWRAAMRLQAIPSFNAVYADHTGEIAYIYNAAIPIRAKDQDWSAAANGADPSLVWSGVHPFGTAPIITNPKSGFVVNANNNPFEATSPSDAPSAENYPRHLGIDLRTTNRGLRLLELFGDDERITGSEFVRYKMDHVYSSDSRLMRFINGLTSNTALARDDEIKAEIDLLRGWSGDAGIENRAAALAIRTGRIALGWYLNGEHARITDPKAALLAASNELKAAFGRIDPTWGEAMRLRRGEHDLALNGGPETLRAVYPDDSEADRAWTAAGGDTYILYADWPAEGEPIIQSIHQFGAATLDRKSPHYDDQAPLFVDERWKRPPMGYGALLEEATSDRRIGGR